MHACRAELYRWLTLNAAFLVLNGLLPSIFAGSVSAETMVFLRVVLVLLRGVADLALAWDYYAKRIRVGELDKH